MMSSSVSRYVTSGRTRATCFTARARTEKMTRADRIQTSCFKFRCQRWMRIKAPQIGRRVGFSPPPIFLGRRPGGGIGDMVFWHDNRVCVRVCSTAQNGLARGRSKISQIHNALQFPTMREGASTRQPSSTP